MGQKGIEGKNGNKAFANKGRGRKGGEGNGEKAAARCVRYRYKFFVMHAIILHIQNVAIKLIKNIAKCVA